MEIACFRAAGIQNVPTAFCGKDGGVYGERCVLFAAQCKPVKRTVRTTGMMQSDATVDTVNAIKRKHKKKKKNGRSIDFVSDNATNKYLVIVRSDNDTWRKTCVKAFGDRVRRNRKLNISIQKYLCRDAKYLIGTTVVACGI